MAFDWAAGTLEWLADRGIEPYEVMQVLGYAKRWPRPANSPAGPVLTVWGRTRAGRAMLVVLWPDRDSLNSTITAVRDLTADEYAELRRWEATR